MRCIKELVSFESLHRSPIIMYKLQLSSVPTNQEQSDFLPLPLPVLNPFTYMQASPIPWWGLYGSPFCAGPQGMPAHWQQWQQYQHQYDRAPNSGPSRMGLYGSPFSAGPQGMPVAHWQQWQHQPEYYDRAPSSGPSRTRRANQQRKGFRKAETPYSEPKKRELSGTVKDDRSNDNTGEGVGKVWRTPSTNLHIYIDD